MSDSKQNKKNEVKGGISPVTAAVAGVIAGAGVAIAGAIALSDKSKRDRIKEKINNVKERVTDFANGVHENVQDKRSEIEDRKGEVENKFLEEKEIVRAAAFETVDSLDNLAKKTRDKVSRALSSVGEKATDISKKMNEK